MESACAVEEPVELVGVSGSSVLEEDPHGVVHHGLGIGGNPAGDREPRREIVVAACPNEVQRGRGRGAPSQGVGRGGQPVQWLGGRAREVAADHAGGGPVDHVPGRDAVVARQVELVQLLALGLIEASPCLEVEDAHRRHPRFVRRVVQQVVDLGQRQVGVRLGHGEQVTHPHPERWLVVREPLADLRQLVVGLDG
jgi:hypothetical protein